MADLLGLASLSRQRLGGEDGSGRQCDDGWFMVCSASGVTGLMAWHAHQGQHHVAAQPGGIEVQASRDFTAERVRQHEEGLRQVLHPHCPPWRLP
jgi:hypothetical protein